MPEGHAHHRISLSTVGSRGDVEPFCALGSGLRRAGYDVTIATHEAFRSMVEHRGLRFAPIPGDPRSVLDTDEARRLLAGGVGSIRFARRFLGLLEPWFDQLVDATAPVVARSDVVVYTPLAFTAWHQAEQRNIPSVLATLQPLEPTRAFATVASPRYDLGRWNLSSHLLVRQLFWQPFRRRVNRWRRDRLGLEPIPLTGPYRRVTGPVLAGFSSTLVPVPADWPDTVAVTGPWRDPNPPPLAPEVEAFCRQGDAPVYVGFGSLVVDEPRRVSDVVAAAIRRTGRRLILESGWSGLRPGVHGDHILVVDGTPHPRLFPLVAVVCHHGGAGTTHTAAAAGVPQVIAASYADQPFWAESVARQGAGVAADAPGRLTVDRLATAIEAATRPETIRGARRLARRVAAEPGVHRAVEVIAAAAERFDLPPVGSLRPADHNGIHTIREGR